MPSSRAGARPVSGVRAGVRTRVTGETGGRGRTRPPPPGVVQPEHGVEPVEQAAELDDVLGLDGRPRRGRRAAARAGRPGARSRRGCGSSPRSRRCRRGRGRPAGTSCVLVGALVREQFALQPVEQGTHRFEVAVVRVTARRRPSGSARSAAAWRRARPAAGRAVATSSAGIAMVCTAAGQHGPQRDADRQHVDDLLQRPRRPPGGSSPTAAATIATSDSPMPTRTACSAIRFERRAMRIASARASIRSTVSTTSAASEDAVAPRAASATPTPAAASAGASLTPSPTMIVAPCADSRSIAASLSAGSQSASTVSTPTMRPTMSAMSARSPVTSTTRRDPGLAQRAHHPGRVGPDRVLSRNAPAGSSSTATKTVSEPSRSARRRTWRTHGGVVVADDPGRLAEPDPVPADGPLQAVAVHLLDVGRASRRASPRRVPAVTIALASTCGDTWSSDAASRSTSSASNRRRGDDVGEHRVGPGSACRSCRTASPARRPGVSSAPPPLTTTPICAAADSPDMIAIGAASSSGHGVATTSTATAAPGHR